MGLAPGGRGDVLRGGPELPPAGPGASDTRLGNSTEAEQLALGADGVLLALGPSRPARWPVGEGAAFVVGAGARDVAGGGGRGGGVARAGAGGDGRGAPAVDAPAFGQATAAEIVA